MLYNDTVDDAIRALINVYGMNDRFAYVPTTVFNSLEATARLKYTGMPISAAIRQCTVDPNSDNGSQCDLDISAHISQAELESLPGNRFIIFGVQDNSRGHFYMAFWDRDTMLITVVDSLPCGRVLYE